MDENTVRVDEIEEYKPDEIEVDEAPKETSAGGAFIAGIVGGFLAYATISGAKKLVTFTREKLAARKQKEITKTAVDADYTEVTVEQEEPEK